MAWDPETEPPAGAAAKLAIAHKIATRPRRFMLIPPKPLSSVYPKDKTVLPKEKGRKARH